MVSGASALPTAAPADIHISPRGQPDDEAQTQEIPVHQVHADLYGGQHRDDPAARRGPVRQQHPRPPAPPPPHPTRRCSPASATRSTASCPASTTWPSSFRARRATEEIRLLEPPIRPEAVPLLNNYSTELQPYSYTNGFFEELILFFGRTGLFVSAGDCRAVRRGVLRHHARLPQPDLRPVADLPCQAPAHERRQRQGSAHGERRSWTSARTSRTRRTRPRPP